MVRVFLIFICWGGRGLPVANASLPLILPPHQLLPYRLYAFVFNAPALQKNSPLWITRLACQDTVGGETYGLTVWSRGGSGGGCGTRQCVNVVISHMETDPVQAATSPCLTAVFLWPG